MQISLSNNPLDKLDCFLHNKTEELSRVIWLMGEQKKAECRICGDVMDSYKDVFSPTQAGWRRIGKYTWVCHNCLEHRNFRPFIKIVDEADRKYWEEHNLKSERIRNKAQEIIDLLKEYLPEYKETLDLYQLYDLNYYDENGQLNEFWFSFEIEDKDSTYVLDITNTGILKESKDKDNYFMESIAYYINDEALYQRTKESPWTWDDAIIEIKRQIAERKTN